jgi:AraC family transcriptional regulator
LPFSLSIPSSCGVASRFCLSAFFGKAKEAFMLAITFPERHRETREEPTMAQHRATARTKGPLATATIKVVQSESLGALDVLVRPEHFRVELCVTPRAPNARGCFVDAWGGHRFVPLGDIVFIPPGHALHVRADAPAGGSAIICSFGGPYVERWLAGLEWTDQRLEAALDIASIAIRRLLRSLAEEARAGHEDSATLMELLAGELAIELGRYFAAVDDLPSRGGLAPWRLQLIDERLKVEGSPPELAELAAACGLSVRQLTRGYRTSRGCTIGDTIAHDRIETAKRMLRGDQNIKALARTLGFATTSSFAAAFRRATALTPNQFRQRILRPSQ